MSRNTIGCVVLPSALTIFARYPTARCVGSLCCRFLEKIKCRQKTAAVHVGEVGFIGEKRGQSVVELGTSLLAGINAFEIGGDPNQFGQNIPQKDIRCVIKGALCLVQCGCDAEFQHLGSIFAIFGIAEPIRAKKPVRFRRRQSSPTSARRRTSRAS